jgi:hypothetical protein
MSTTSRRRMKAQAVRDKCQVEIVDLKGSYIRTAGTKWAEILDGTELCRVEELQRPRAQAFLPAVSRSRSR